MALQTLPTRKPHILFTSPLAITPDRWISPSPPAALSVRPSHSARVRCHVWQSHATERFL